MGTLKHGLFDCIHDSNNIMTPKEFNVGYLSSFALSNNVVMVYNL